MERLRDKSKRWKVGRKFFIRMPIWISGRQDIVPAEKLIYAFLHTLWFRFASEEDRALGVVRGVGYSMIALTTGLAKRTVISTVAALKGRGWLEVLEPAAGTRPAAYRLVEVIPECMGGLESMFEFERPEDAFGICKDSTNLHDPRGDLGSPLRGDLGSPLRGDLDAPQGGIPHMKREEDGPKRARDARDSENLEPPKRGIGRAKPLGHVERTSSEIMDRLGCDPARRRIGAALERGIVTVDSFASIWHFAWLDHYSAKYSDSFGTVTGPRWQKSSWTGKEVGMAKRLIADYGVGIVDILRAAVLGWEDAVVAGKRKNAHDFWNLPETPTIHGFFATRVAWTARVRDWTPEETEALGWLGTLWFDPHSEE